MSEILDNGLGNFLKKDLLFTTADKSRPRDFIIWFGGKPWARKYFSDKVKAVVETLYLFECWNTTMEVRGFQNGIFLKSVIQDDREVVWPYELTARVIRNIMKRLNLKTITVYHDDFGKNYYVLDNMLNIVSIEEVGEGGG